MITLNSLLSYKPSDNILGVIQLITEPYKEIPHFIVDPGMPYHGLEVLDVCGEIMKLKLEPELELEEERELSLVLNFHKYPLLKFSTIKPDPHPVSGLLPTVENSATVLTPALVFYCINHLHFNNAVIAPGETDSVLYLRADDCSRGPLFTRFSEESNSKYISLSRLRPLRKEP